MSLETDRNRGTDAKAVLDNPAFKMAMDKLKEHVEGVALSCHPDDKERAQRVIITKQLLQSVERELIKIIKDGEIAIVQLDEIEKRKLRLFKR